MDCFKKKKHPKQLATGDQITMGRFLILSGMRVRLSRKPFCGRDTSAPIIIRTRNNQQVLRSYYILNKHLLLLSALPQINQIILKITPWKRGNSHHHFTEEET